MTVGTVKKVIEIFAKKHYKVITVCAAAGSEHPIIPTIAVNAYHKKLISQQKDEDVGVELDEDSPMIESLSNVTQWTIADNEDVLLGPEIKVAMDSEVEELYAIAYRDIFDKKIAQKILCFFINGFPNTSAILNRWTVVPKVVKSACDPLFVDDIKEDKLEDAELIEKHLITKCTILTTAQRSCEWFTLRTFHLTATMAGKLFTSATNFTPTEVMEKLMASWFSRTRSTTPMVIGSKNENAVLKAFSNLDYVCSVFDVGLIEHSDIPWLAASPDAVAIIQTTEDFAGIVPVEVKTRVAPDRILEAERIAQDYNCKLIFCGVGDEVWKECVEPEHSTQVMMQMLVLRVTHGIYIVARPGTREGHGRILYVVMGKWTEEDATNFKDRLLNNVHELLILFYECSTVGELLHQLPRDLDGKHIDIIATRWPFFKSVREVALSWNPGQGPLGFPKTELFKTSFQCLYNSLKGGLDANTQQYMTIMPKINVKFEQKYVLRMILAVVTNSWRAFQLLRCTNAIEHTSLISFKTKMKNMKLTLMDYNHKLAIGLLRVADDKKMSNMLYLGIFYSQAA